MNNLFRSPEHRQRFLEVMQAIGTDKDTGYTSAVYILSSRASTLESAKTHIGKDGIDFEEILNHQDWSGGYKSLLVLASDIFNGNTPTSMIDVCTRLDSSNFQVALHAIGIRHYGLPSLETQLTLEMWNTKDEENG